MNQEDQSDSTQEDSAIAGRRGNQEKQSNAKQKAGEFTGRTWPDLISGFPLWVIISTLLLFVGVLIFAMFFAPRPFSLGFLGDYGPKEAIILNKGEIPDGTVLAWDPVIRNEKGVINGRRDLPAGWIRCGDQLSTSNLDGKFLMGASSIRSAGEEGGSKEIAYGGEHIHAGHVVGRHAFDTVCNGHCGIPAVAPNLVIDKAGLHSHGDNRPPFYSVIFLCPAPNVQKANK